MRKLLWFALSSVLTMGSAEAAPTLCERFGSWKGAGLSRTGKPVTWVVFIDFAARTYEARANDGSYRATATGSATVTINKVPRVLQVGYTPGNTREMYGGLPIDEEATRWLGGLLGDEPVIVTLPNGETYSIPAPGPEGRDAIGSCRRSLFAVPAASRDPFAPAGSGGPAREPFAPL